MIVLAPTDVQVWKNKKEETKCIVYGLVGNTFLVKDYLTKKPGSRKETRQTGYFELESPIFHPQETYTDKTGRYPDGRNPIQAKRPTRNLDKGVQFFSEWLCRIYPYMDPTKTVSVNGTYCYLSELSIPQFRWLFDNNPGAIGITKAWSDERLGEIEDYGEMLDNELVEENAWQPDPEIRSRELIEQLWNLLWPQGSGTKDEFFQALKLIFGNQFDKGPKELGLKGRSYFGNRGLIWDSDLEELVLEFLSSELVYGERIHRLYFTLSEAGLSNRAYGD